MKSILFVTLLLIISCENIQESNDSDVVSFYKCLLLDSDVVYNQINSLVEAIKSLDPVKLTTTFTTIVPVITAEVTKCKAKQILFRKLSTEEEEQPVKKTSGKVNFFKALLKAVTTYLMPFLKNIGIDLKGICKDAFPDVFICDLLE